MIVKNSTVQTKIAILLATWVVVSLAAAGRVNAHQGHFSIADAEFNAETRCLEVALRVRAEDLEQAVRRSSGEPITLDESEACAQAVRSYLFRNFTARTADGQPIELNWVGCAVAIKEAWLYFEIPVAGRLIGTRIEHRLLCDLLPDQVNTINFRAGGDRTTLWFNADHRSRTLDFRPPEPQLR